MGFERHNLLILGRNIALKPFLTNRQATKDHYLIDHNQADRPRSTSDLSSDIFEAKRVFCRHSLVFA